MKNRFLLYVLIGLLFPAALAAQDKAYVEITAARFTESTAKTYLTEYRLTGMKVDKEGVLTAEKGYDMFYNPYLENVIVKPVKVHVETNAEDYEAKDVPGGTMFCLCDAANDDCSITVTIENNTIHYFCDGGCNCGSFTIFDVDDIVSDVRVLGANDWTSVDK